MTEEKKKKKPRRIKGEGSISYIEKKKTYRGFITIGYDLQTGKQIKKYLYSKSRPELIKKMQEFQKQENLLPSDKITFNSYFHKFLYQIKKPELKDKSFERYNGLYEKYIKKAPFFYNRLADITYTDIQIWYNEANIPPSSLQTINRLIKATFKIAKIDKIITTNPLDDITIKKPKKQKTNKYNVFTSQEQKTFLEYLYQTTLEQEPMKYLYIFTLSTGLRLGEVLALEKTDIRDGKVYINKNLQRVKDENGKYHDKILTVKTQSSESSVPLIPKVKNMLPEILNTTGNLLFPDEKTNSYIFKNRPYKRLQSLCKKLNLNIITFHGLRHSYATRLFEQGIQIKTVQKLMRHSDIKMTMNIYVHVMPDIVEDAINKLDNIF